MIIVSDTTSLIVLEKLEVLDLLCRLFKRVIIPRVVLDEIAVGSPGIFKTFETMSCFEILDVPKTSRLQSLLVILDDGEANAIELAMIKQLPLIIDERKGRQVAQQLGIKVTGFAGLLIQACRSKIIEREEAVSLLDQAMENGLRLSDSLQLQVRNKLLDE
ncbi:hypothetical protein [Leucothrix mucor]|uniref:hypothetical protein n=1 Tax=Leucothrix mucor TaxID=45248 RepID=UPI0003B4B958|nr:hypothetical protein [Leucothrix mucor]